MPALPLDPEDKCTDLLEQIDKTRAALAGKRPLNQSELAKLREVFITDYTYNSNAIEGNTLTLQETAIVLEGITISGKSVKEHLEAVGHRDAFLYLESLVKEKRPFSEDVIKDIHSYVLLDEPLERGNYRTGNVGITGSPHIPPVFEIVPNLMKDLVLDFQNSKLHTIEQTAIFHLDFETIHPFINGNGRTGRLLMNLTLMKDGYLPINIKYANVSKYYSAFETYRKTHSPIDMIILTAEHALSALQDHLNIIEKKEEYETRKLRAE
jgi:Fic family protein